MEEIYFAGGQAEHRGDFFFHLPNGHHCWLLVLTKTAAQFEVNGEMKRFDKNHAVLFEPHQSIKYKADGESYINGWIRFQLDDSFFHLSELSHGVPIRMEDHEACHQLTHAIAHEHYHGNKVVSIHLLKGLLNKLMYHSEKKQKDLKTKFAELHQEIVLNPGFPWTITYMSSLLSMSEGYFHRTYKALHGKTCIADVIDIRLEHAANLLRENDLQIAEIAYQCGYKNVEHFSRQFKEKFLVSPRDYQKSKEIQE